MERASERTNASVNGTKRNGWWVFLIKRYINWPLWSAYSHRRRNVYSLLSVIANDDMPRLSFVHRSFPRNAAPDHNVPLHWSILIRARVTPIATSSTKVTILLNRHNHRDGKFKQRKACDWKRFYESNDAEGYLAPLLICTLVCKFRMRISLFILPDHTINLGKCW